MYCGKCGKQVPENANFCPNCGNKIEKVQGNVALEHYASMNKEKEYRKKCNVCGQIICYTKTDLELSKTNQTLAALYGFKSLTNMVGGSTYKKFEYGKRADMEQARVVDYTKCPNCHSSDLIDLV